MEMRIFLFVLVSLMVSGCFRVPQSIEDGFSMELTEYAKMPEVANECSGLVLNSEEIIVLNDGGAGPYLVHLTKDGVDTIKRTLVKGVRNVDWEAMIAHEDEILIGEFGNNLGQRKDLKIYHIDSERFELKETIEFSYPDQDRFDVQRHNFDCEAFIVKDGKYYLFSKNRGNKNSNIYTAPFKSNEFEFQDSIQLKGMVTDAVYHKASKTILLLCYDFGIGGFKNSLALVKENRKGAFRVTNIFNIAPPEQFEAITQLSDNEFLIGSEKGLGNGKKLYTVKIDGL